MKHGYSLCIFTDYRFYSQSKVFQPKCCDAHKPTGRKSSYCHVFRMSSGTLSGTTTLKEAIALKLMSHSCVHVSDSCMCMSIKSIWRETRSIAGSCLRSSQNRHLFNNLEAICTNKPFIVNIYLIYNTRKF